MMQMQEKFAGCRLVSYCLMCKLQVDQLVDRQLTPQTKASIRIVLGTVDHFARISSTEGAV